MYNASFIAAVFLALILIYSISRLSELYTYLFWVLVSEFKHNIPGSLLCVHMCICAILESVAQQCAFTYCAAEFDRRCSYSKSALFYISFQCAVMCCLHTQAVCNPCNFLFIYANGIRTTFDFSIFIINLFCFANILYFLCLCAD